MPYGEDGQEEVAGWAMVLPDHVVSYVPDPTGSATACTFQSLESAAWILGYTDIYSVRYALPCRMLSTEPLTSEDLDEIGRSPNDQPLSVAADLVEAVDRGGLWQRPEGGSGAARPARALDCLSE